MARFVAHLPEPVISMTEDQGDIMIVGQSGRIYRLTLGEAGYSLAEGSSAAANDTPIPRASSSMEKV